MIDLCTKVLKIENFEFISIENKKVNFIFSTAKGNLDFNKLTLKDTKNFNYLKKWFKLKEIGYLNQIHSDFIYNYDGKVHDGDALITNKNYIGIGVFTADCVPILIYDSVKKVIAAVHSGWKGTLNCLVAKTINKLIKEYSSNPKDLNVIIGPHIGKCCYEVGDEVIDKFNNCDIYKEVNIFNNKKLDLKKCILTQLEYKNILKENVKSIDICTFCSKQYHMYSYRKNKNFSRMFSFVFLK